MPAYQGFSVPVTYDMLSELSADRVSVQGTRLLEQYFPVGETGPIIVLAHRPGCNFDSRTQQRADLAADQGVPDFTYTDSRGVRDAIRSWACGA